VPRSYGGKKSERHLPPKSSHVLKAVSPTWGGTDKIGERLNVFPDKKVWIGETQILCCAYFTCLAKLYSIVVERWCDVPFYFLVEQYLSITPSIDAITCEISHLSSTHMVSKQKHDSYQQKKTLTGS